MDWNTRKNKGLVAAILALKTTGEARAFLRDLLTEGEIEEFAGRLKTAEMLEKKMPYEDIKRETGFSSTTIARVSRWLHHGTGGYKVVLKRLAH